MNKRWFLIITFLLLVARTSATDGWKTLDLNSFKISIPKEWNYKSLQGEDSFIGQIIGPKVEFSFDFSNYGYANSLISTEQEYLKKEEWKNTCYFCKVGVTYTADFNVKNEKAAQMKKLGTSDSSLIHVEAFPDYKTKTEIHVPTSVQKIKFPKADYVADLTFRDSTINIPITIPTEIKAHNINVDTTEKYIIKTIWPKEGVKGITGIYFKGRHSHLTFNLVGFNLSPKDQYLALKAFKTIIIK
jgi:hypothetical protein